MSQKLQLLVIEGHDADYELLLGALRKAGIEHNASRINSGQDVVTELRKRLPDLIIAEFGPSPSSGPALLETVHEIKPFMPVIFVSSSTDVAAAVESVKSGASDFVLKKRIGHIGTSVKEALARAKELEEKENSIKFLRESEERYRFVLESVNEIIYRSYLSDGGRLPGKTEYVSDSVEKVLGYAAQDVVGDPEFWSRAVHPEDSASLLATRNECIKTGTTKRGEFRARHKVTGDYRWIEDHVVPIHDDTNTVIGFQGTARDITERKMVEETLRKLSRALEQTADNVVIADGNGIIEYVNPAFERNTGYSKEEAIGQTPRLLKSGHHPKEFYQHLWESVLGGNVFHAEFLNKKKNGELYYQEETITPVFDFQGNVAHFVSTGRDVTERKLAEKAIRESEERFAKVFHASPAGICLVNVAERRYIDVNETFLKIYGYTRDEVVGKTGDDVQLLAHDHERYSLRDELLSTGSIKDREIQFRRKNGDVGTAIASLELSEINGDKCILVFFHDITHGRHTERTLEQANSQLRTIVDNLEEVFFSVDVVNQKLLQISSACEKVYGHTPDEFMKNPNLWFEVVHPDDLRIVEAAMPSVNADEKVVHSEYRIVRPDGTIRWVEAKIKPTLDAEKHLVRLDGVVADITDRIRSENDFGEG